MRTQKLLFLLLACVSFAIASCDDMMQEDSDYTPPESFTPTAFDESLVEEYDPHNIEWKDNVYYHYTGPILGVHTTYYDIESVYAVEIENSSFAVDMDKETLRRLPFGKIVDFYFTTNHIFGKGDVDEFRISLKSDEKPRVKYVYTTGYTLEGSDPRIAYSVEFTYLNSRVSVLLRNMETSDNNYRFREYFYSGGDSNECTNEDTLWGINYSDDYEYYIFPYSIPSALFDNDYDLFLSYHASDALEHKPYSYYNIFIDSTTIKAGDPTPTTIPLSGEIELSSVYGITNASIYAIFSHKGENIANHSVNVTSITQKDGKYILNFDGAKIDFLMEPGLDIEVKYGLNLGCDAPLYYFSKNLPLSSSFKTTDLGCSISSRVSSPEPHNQELTISFEPGTIVSNALLSEVCIYYSAQFTSSEDIINYGIKTSQYVYSDKNEDVIVRLWNLIPARTYYYTIVYSIKDGKEDPNTSYNQDVVRIKDGAVSQFTTMGKNLSFKITNVEADCITVEAESVLDNGVGYDTSFSFFCGTTQAELDIQRGGSAYSWIHASGMMTSTIGGFSPATTYLYEVYDSQGYYSILVDKGTFTTK